MASGTRSSRAAFEARPTAARAAAPRRRRKDERPSELLEAALELFVEKGFAASKIDDVAARAGVSKGTLYLYYPSKESLLKAVIRHHLSLPIASGAEAFAAYRGPMSTLLREALIPAWMQMVEGPASGVVKLVVTEARNFPEISAFYAREVIEPVHRLVGTVIERGIARREFRRVDIPDTVRSIMLPLVMLCLYRHSLCASAPTCVPPMDHDDHLHFIDRHLDLVLRGLAPDAAVRPRPAPTPAPFPSIPARRTVGKPHP